MKVLAVNALALSCQLGFVLADGYHGYTVFYFFLGFSSDYSAY